MGLSPNLESGDLRAAVYVWMVFTDRLSAGWEERCFSWLTPDERVRHDQHATPALRREFLATRALCRATLSRYTGVDPAAWVFAAGAHGKPASAAPAAFPSLRFNLTRTSGLAACAVTCAGDVGLDAEETSRDLDVARMARHFFSNEEQAAMNALPPDQQMAWFFGQWTLKEAYLKGRGTGLSEPPEAFSIDREVDGAPRPIGQWRLSLHRPGPAHVAAVAVRSDGPSAEIPVFWFETTAF